MFVETKREGEAPAVQQQGPSLAGLIAWLETQPPEQTYDWYDVENCVACRYFRAIGYPPAWEAVYANKPTIYFNEVFGGSARYHAIGRVGKWTYGTALERARALAG